MAAYGRDLLEALNEGFDDDAHEYKAEEIARDVDDAVETYIELDLARRVLENAIVSALRELARSDAPRHAYAQELLRQHSIELQPVA